jgi:hypothetical protein
MQERRTGRHDPRDARWAGGDITDEGAERILMDLSACGVTGLWEVYAGDRVYRMALRSGAPIHVFPGRTPWLLGDVLEHMGAPIRGGQDGLRRTLALNPGLSGSVLVEHGIIMPKYLDWALKEQISLRAAEFLPLTEGRYRVWAGTQFLKCVPRQPDRWQSAELIAAVRGSRDDDLRRLLGRLGRGDPVAALGLEPGASRADVREAFRRLALEHHPDRLPPSTDPRRLALHRQVFEASVRAYELATAA